MSSFDSNSSDSLFSRILTKLEEQDRTAEKNHTDVKRILESNTKRIESLERERWYQRGAIFTVGVIATWAYKIFAGKGGP